MRRALFEYEVSGIKTTLPFFREVMEDEEFQSGDLDTGFIARLNERRKPYPPEEVISDVAMIAAALSASKKSVAATGSSNSNGASRWVMSGRTAIQNR